MKTNTILGLELFNTEIKDTFIFHIPHSSTTIPNNTGYVVEELTIKTELDLVTDWFTDVLFDIKGIDKIVFPYSRLFCDVERLNDEHEEMFKVGRGFYYTHLDNKQHLREVNIKHKEHIYNEYYLKQHNKLNSLVESKLKKYDICHIIDCHSFNDAPIISDTNQDTNRADICLGIDSYHTPKHMKLRFKAIFEKHGYTVEINKPYSGTIVPLKYYKNDKRVNSIMIEINKRIK